MEKKWDPLQYQQTAGFVSSLGEPLIELLNPNPGMQVLDLGCGDGTLTLKLMEKGVEVIGIDASPEMVDAACQKGIQAFVMDAHEMTFNEAFDAVFSNAALHWMKRDPQRVLQNVANALKPGGRFVAEMGGRGNIQMIRTAIQKALEKRHLDGETLDPIFFPSIEEYQGLLENAGFRVTEILLFNRPTRLSNGLMGWLKVFANRVLSVIPPQERDAFIGETEAYARPYLYDDQGWWADYVRLRFVALKR